MPGDEFRERLAGGLAEIARIGIIAIGSYFAGPTIIGGIAELTSLPIAFAFPVLLMFGAAYQSRFITVKRLSHEN